MIPFHLLFFIYENSGSKITVDSFSLISGKYYLLNSPQLKNLHMQPTPSLSTKPEKATKKKKKKKFMINLA